MAERPDSVHVGAKTVPRALVMPAANINRFLSAINIRTRLFYDVFDNICAPTAGSPAHSGPEPWLPGFFSAEYVLARRFFKVSGGLPWAARKSTRPTRTFLAPECNAVLANCYRGGCMRASNGKGTVALRPDQTEVRSTVIAFPLSDPGSTNPLQVGKVLPVPNLTIVRGSQDRIAQGIT